MENTWNDILKDILESENYKLISKRYYDESKKYTVYPSQENIFKCFKITPFENLKVVILGQDPYHEEGQAMGLSFSVPNGTPLPPSLKNIYEEYSNDLGYPIPSSGDLTKWANEGVLLLNTTLTVRKGLANSHKYIGWAWFTDEVIKKINKYKNNIVFILWGSNAISKKQFIDSSRHKIIESVHPSPLSAYRGFFGSKPFSKTNEYLISKNIKPIDWKLC